jgi:putative transposase
VAAFQYARAVPDASARDPLYRGYRFPAEIISFAVWLYYRFHFSHLDVEDLLAERHRGQLHTDRFLQGREAARLAPAA